MTTPTCPDCGTALPADSPQSLCPACLLRQALASRTVVNGDARSSAPPPTPEEIADKFPQFEILECLGRGGMGVVYKARQKSLNRLVAIKILAPDREHEPRFAERFAHEAELLARLNHPHIVTIHDFGETGGLFYLVMEFVDGVNLRDLLRDGKLEPKQALAIVPPICEALQYAHDKGIVHRDIKPENLLLDREGRIKIADFGIAALMGAEGENSGTPPYMAPEQGGDRTGIDHRADLYALGVVLYEMLTGERPGKDLIAPSRKVQIDVRLDEMVLRALEKEPERRYQTAGEFRTVVETFQSTAPAPAAIPPLPAGATPTPGPFRRFWWLFLVMPPVFVLLALGLGFIWTYVAPKVYEARTVVQVLPPTGMTHPADWMTWAEALRSNESLEQVSERLGLVQRWMLPEERVVAKLRPLVQVSRIPGTDLLELSIRHTDPTEAAAIANQLVADDVETHENRTSNQREPYPIIVHEKAVPPRIPVSPNAPRVLAISAAAGFLLSPLAALLLILKLGRSPRGPTPPTNARPGGFARFLFLFATLASVMGLLGVVAGWISSRLMPDGSGSNTLIRDMALAGIALSPLAALVAMYFQRRRSPGAYDPASKSRMWWIVVSQLAMVILVGLGKSWLIPANASDAGTDGKVLIGRAKFDFEIPQAHTGWGAELPVFEGETSRWFPSSGQSVQLKDGRTLHFRVLTMAPVNARPRMVVGISENGSDWTSESVEMGPSRGKATIGLDHGATATLHWTPGTDSVPGPTPVSGTPANWIFIVAGIVVLLLLVGGIMIIARLARSKQSGGGKALGIGCTVLLLAGVLLGLVPVALIFFYRAMQMENQSAQRMRQSQAKAEFEAQAERGSLRKPGSIPSPKATTITLTVHGAVARPGPYTLRPDATLLDALAAAGGWTDDAKLDEIFINFNGKGSAYDLRKILDGRDPNPALATGHNVFVARRKP